MRHAVRTAAAGRTAVTASSHRPRPAAGVAGAAEQRRPLGHADEPEAAAARGARARSPSSLTVQPHRVVVAATSRTSIRVARRAWRSALVTDSCASR